MSRRNKREQQSLITNEHEPVVEPVEVEEPVVEPVEEPDTPAWYRVCSAGSLITSSGLQVSVRPGKLILACDMQMYADAGFELEPWLG